MFSTFIKVVFCGRGGGAVGEGSYPRGLGVSTPETSLPGALSSGMNFWKRACRQGACLLLLGMGPVVSWLEVLGSRNVLTLHPQSLREAPQSGLADPVLSSWPRGVGGRLEVEATLGGSQEFLNGQLLLLFFSFSPHPSPCPSWSYCLSLCVFPCLCLWDSLSLFFCLSSSLCFCHSPFFFLCLSLNVLCFFLSASLPLISVPFSPL